MEKKYHVYALGNALVDTEVEVTDEFLTRLDLSKGLMTLVDEARQQELVAALRKVPIFTGPRDSDEELAALKTQARELAGLLYRWNTKPPSATGNAQLT
jgi:hypothetical protein